MRQLARFFLLILIGAFLYGCAKPVDNIALSDGFWKSQKHSIVVAKTRFENKPQLHKVGPQGIFDYSINSGMTQKFSEYLKHNNMSWYGQLQEQFVNQLKKRKISAQAYTMDLNPKQKENFASAIQLEGDKILLLELLSIGAIRNYQGFIPMDAPKAYCVIEGKLIEQQDKKVLWRHLAKIEEPVHGDWDQPPSYPNFAIAFKQAIDSAQEEIIDSFFSGH